MSTPVAEFDYEESALAETLPPAPPVITSAIVLRDTCEVLWLPPCPKCSWVALWRRPVLDRLEAPGFNLARHTTAREGVNNYMLMGCEHASDVGAKFGPTRNRLKLAIGWRRKAAELLAGMFQNGYTDEQRALFNIRLGHPSLINSTL